MFRTLATTAILTMTMALTWSTAQADTLSDRIQAVAQAACAVERVSRGLPASHYSAIYRHCVDRLSRGAAVRREQADNAGHAGHLATR